MRICSLDETLSLPNLPQFLCKEELKGYSRQWLKRIGIESSFLGLKIQVKVEISRFVLLEISYRGTFQGLWLSPERKINSILFRCDVNNQTYICMPLLLLPEAISPPKIAKSRSCSWGRAWQKFAGWCKSQNLHCEDFATYLVNLVAFVMKIRRFYKS